MFSALVKKEILNNLLSLRFAVTFLLLVALISCSVLMMAANYQKQSREYFNARAAHRQRVERMRDESEFEALGIMARRQPNPLSVFATGLEPDMSRSVTLNSWLGVVAVEVGSTPYANPVFALFVTPDVTYVTNIVISLLAMLLVFDAVCGEKEQETLKLMLSNPVPRDLVLLGKCVGSFACLSASFLLSFFVALLVARVTMSLVFTGGAWLRIGTLVFVSLLYISAFIMLGLFISTCAQKSGTSLMISLLVWVVLVLGIPNLVPVVARQIVPVQASNKLVRERAIQEEEIERLREQIRRDTSPEKRGRLIAEALSRMQERWHVLEESYLNKFMRQASVAKWMSRISPSACFTYASTALAHTGVRAYERFMRYLYGDFRAEFERVLPELRTQLESRGRRGEGIDVDKLPEFAPRQEATGRVLGNSLLDIGLLVAYNMLFFVGAYVKFMRYDLN